jgi:hypothetical protein
MIDESELGPPRFVRTTDAYCAEVDRQRKLVVSGDLKSYDGVTWAWCKFDEGTHWRWLSRWSTTCGGHYPNREDRETAWKVLVDYHERNS